jgi:phosphatidylethanolamine-binding protein (PEBP) family uncharacterized protein
MTRIASTIVLGIAPFFLLACGSAQGDEESLSEITLADHGPFVVTSPDFADGDALPDANTCNGKPFGAGVSPELAWSGAPQYTKSYALVFKDISLTEAVPPDNRGYHNAIWDIAKNDDGLPAALGSSEFLGDPKNDARQWSRYSPYGYLGPCPNFSSAIPVHEDTYSFTLYAMPDKITELPPVDPAIPNYTRVLDAHFASLALAKTELIVRSAAIPTAAPVPPGPAPAPAPRP